MFSHLLFLPFFESYFYFDSHSLSVHRYFYLRLLLRSGSILYANFLFLVNAFITCSLLICSSQFHFLFLLFGLNRQFSFILIYLIDKCCTKIFWSCLSLSMPFILFMVLETSASVVSIIRVLNNSSFLTFDFIQKSCFSSLYNIESHIFMYCGLKCHIIAVAYQYFDLRIVLKTISLLFVLICEVFNIPLFFLIAISFCFRILICGSSFRV